jgi:tetratricopeptide (TPR) repeat protein
MTATRLWDESVNAYVSQGLSEQKSHNWKAALAQFSEAANRAPGSAALHFLIGDTLSRLGNWAGARESYKCAVAIEPGYADAYNNLGLSLLETGCEREAIAAFAKAAEVNPRHANAYFNLGRMCARRNEFAAALTMFQKTLAIDPRHAYAYLEVGALLHKCGYLEKSATFYRRSLELDPTRTVRSNLAAVLLLLGDPDGIALQEQLVREQPNDAEAHWNLGMGLLRHTRCSQGWREFEWRTEVPRYYQRHHLYDKPRWNGEPLQGKTILLYGEQGHGDTLQFLRYLPSVAQCGGRLLLHVPPLLRELLQGLPDVAACTGFGDTLTEFDTFASLMSLPHLLQSQSIPPPALLPGRAIRGKNGTASGRLQVGLAWAGNPKQERDHLRSIPLSQWNGLAQIEGVDFSALQMGPPNPHAGNEGHAFHFSRDCAEVKDFAELAAVVADLDLVITVDTAIAHLAGTMGKPVWILLPNAADWRWGLHTSTTPWYPTARLFRQATPADWTGVMAEVAREIEKQATR